VDKSATRYCFLKAQSHQTIGPSTLMMNNLSKFYQQSSIFLRPESFIPEEKARFRIFFLA